MSWSRLEVGKEAQNIDSSIRVRVKEENWLMRLYAKLPWTGEAFLKDTATCIGPLHWYPRDWHGEDVLKAVHHEGEHTRQMRRCGLGISPWLGLIPFFLICLLPLPVGLAYFRFRFELEAESSALLYKLRTGSSPVYVRGELVEFAERLGGAGYFWTWPVSWARRAAERRAFRIIVGDS